MSDIVIVENINVIELTVVDNNASYDFSINEIVESIEFTVVEVFGKDGDKGEKGDKGDTGNQGIQGLQGIQGEQGIQGLHGLKGDKGDKGDKGNDGFTPDLSPYALLTDLAAEASTRLANDTAEITARQNADNAESNARTFADGVLDSKITTEKNRNDTQDGLISVNTTAIATLNSHKSSVVDKMLHYWDETAGKWLSSGLHWASSTLLEFAGRLKVNGILIEETTNEIQPKEIKFKDGRFKAALADGIERLIPLDANPLDFNNLVDIWFVDNIAWMRPNIGATTYTFYNSSTGVVQAGHTSYNQNNSNISSWGIKYSSSGSTIGKCHGIIYNTSSFGGLTTLNVYREFMILTNVPTQRVFVGYSDNWRSPGMNPTNVAMSTLTYVVGFCMESGNPNLQLIHNDDTGSAILIDTGWVNNSKYIYGFYLSQYYGDTNIYIRLKRFDTITGLTEWWTHTVTGDYKVNSHSAALWCVDELNTSTVSVVDFGLIGTHRRYKL